VYYLGLLIHVILVSTSFLVKDDSIFYGLVFLMGLEQVARFTVGYVYLSEFCCNHIQRPLVTTLAMFISAESAMICAIYFRYISKKWQYFELVGLGMALIALFSVCFIPESPRWLISRGRYKKAFEVYKVDLLVLLGSDQDLIEGPALLGIEADLKLKLQVVCLVLLLRCVWQKGG
jgi:hypothetical protein